jgi:hypothetical protein
MSAVSPPATPVVPVYPALGSPTFNDEAYAYGSAMPGVSTGIGALAANAYANALEAFQRAAEAVSASAVSIAAANFKGTWSALSGSIAVPSSVSHSGKFWMLLQNLANVTTQTPGSAPTYWQEINPLFGNATGGINFLKGSDVASATTPDIWTAALGNVIGITGTTTTTGFATAPQAGATRTLIAAGAWPLTHGANLILPGSANYTCSAGDRLEVLAITTTQFRVSIFKADGRPVVNPSGLICLSVQTISGASNVVFTGIDGTYDEYEFHFQNSVPSVSGLLRFRTSSNGGVSYDSGGSDYSYAQQFTQASVSGTIFANSNTANSSFLAGVSNASTTTAHGGDCGVLRLFNPASTTHKKNFRVDAITNVSSSDFFEQQASGSRNSTSAINAVEFSYSGGGTLTGLFKMYGLRKTV